MRKKLYRSAVIATIISCAAMAVLTWYAVGIIEKSNMEDALVNRVEQITEMLDSRQKEYDKTAALMYDDYKSRVRALSMHIAEEPELMDNETQFEGLRMMTGAEVISVTDENLKIEHTTGLDGEPEIKKEFAAGVNSTVFSEALVQKDDDCFRVTVGCSRIDKKGIVQVSFMPQDIEIFLGLTDISNMLTNIPVMKSGSLGIINRSTMNYESHTIKDMNGTPSHLTAEALPDENGGLIDTEINGVDSLLRYSYSGDHIVVGYVSYSEVYETRNDIIIWVITAALFVAVVVVLVVRNKLLRITRKKN